jgi:multiple sugar transport system permease protein
MASVTADVRFDTASIPKANKRSARGRKGRAGAYAVLAVIFICFVAPMLWLLIASIDRTASIGGGSAIALSFSNFDKVLNWTTTFKPLINSAILSGFTALLTVSVSALAAYPLSRYQMRFRKPFLFTIVFATGLPVTAILAPVYALFAHFSLVNSVPATILFMTTTSLPFGIWLMKNFMDGVPLDLEQAAWVDGADWVDSLRRIVLPLMMPGITVIAIFTFVTQWGNFFIPFILLQSTSKLPASVSIYNFFNQYGSVDYGELAAFSVLYTAPAVALYGVMSKFLGGFTFAGAVKG